MIKIILYFLAFSCSQSLLLAQEFEVDTRYYPATGEEKNVAIMFFGGSEGGYPSYPYLQNELTKLGYPCVGVAYFKTENTPKNLSEIPLEYFEQAIESYLQKPKIKGKKLVVIGNSKGGELVLILASKFPEIKGVIAEVPSHVVWQGVNADWTPANTSSWSYQGKPLPYVPFDLSSQKGGVEGYMLSLQQKEEVLKATIQVQNIRGAVLLISGVDDRMWPSTFMADEVTKRLKENKFSFWYRHDAYENAGHLFNAVIPEYLQFGGTKEGSRKAKIGLEKSILEFLKIVEEH